MILTRVGRSHRKGLHSGRKAARLSYFARGSTERTPKEHVEIIESRLREENNRFGVRQATKLLLAEMSYNYEKEPEKLPPITLDRFLTEPNGLSSEKTGTDAT